MAATTGGTELHQARACDRAGGARHDGARRICSRRPRLLFRKSTDLPAPWYEGEVNHREITRRTVRWFKNVIDQKLALSEVSNYVFDPGATCKYLSHRYFQREKFAIFQYALCAAEYFELVSFDVDLNEGGALE
jgi:hypothetical protein